MSWLEFIVQMSNAWAWPVVATGAIVFLRKPIKSAATRLVARVDDIRSLKAAGVDVEFGEKAKKLAEETGELADERAAAVSSDEESVTIHDRLSRYRERAAIEPDAAVLGSFGEVETLLRMEYVKRNPDANPYTQLNDIFSELQEDGSIDSDAYRSLVDLNDLRNRVAQDRVKTDPRDAYYFIQSVENIVGYLASKGIVRPPS